MDRVVRNSQVTLSQTFYSDEAPVDATGSVSVVVKNSAGTTLASGTATHGATGVYTYTLAGQPALDVLTVTWTGVFGGASQSLTSYVEVVGNRLYSLPEARQSDISLVDPIKYTTAELEVARQETEDEFESILGVALVPRGCTEVLDSTGVASLQLSKVHVNTVLSVTVDGVAFTADELAALSISKYGEIVRTDLGYFGYTYWRGQGSGLGRRNVVVSYEYGFTSVPADLRRAALLRQRTRLISANSGIPDRATSFQPAEGGTYTLATPGRAGYKTGIPDVDAVLARYSFKAPGVF